MADNSTQQGNDTVASDDITSGVANGAKVQRIKVGFGADSIYSDVGPTNPLPASPRTGTGTQTSVTAAITDTSLLSSTPGRIRYVIHNDSTAVLKLLAAAGTASATVFTLPIAAGGTYVDDVGWTGQVRGIWAAANGSARITEYT